MERYDYLESLKNDIKSFITENSEELKKYSSKSALEEVLCEVLYIEDTVTGNASGSYFCNRWKAEQAICHNLDLLDEALQEFGDPAHFYKRAVQDPEFADVVIRCHLLPQAITEVLDSGSRKTAL